MEVIGTLGVQVNGEGVRKVTPAGEGMHLHLAAEMRIQRV